MMRIDRRYDGKRAVICRVSNNYAVFPNKYKHRKMGKSVTIAKTTTMAKVTLTATKAAILIMEEMILKRALVMKLVFSIR